MSTRPLVPEVTQAEQLSRQLNELRRPANDRQVGGDHYKTPHGRQHWDVVHEFKLDYFQGQITRYLFRWRRKGGIEDLRKARHFLDKYIELAEREEGKEG